ncbi:TPA: hypothetical protein JAJ28_001968 [Aeromonas hydrophila]|uniref:Uncharacterized protein n=1 Tax=Aeromonas hydrophila TaxID=644 RepID=A0AAD3UCB1_AERHY|nr:hypothetical protein [Aeromonas hydrophila]
MFLLSLSLKKVKKKSEIKYMLIFKSQKEIWDAHFFVKFEMANSPLAEAGKIAAHGVTSGAITEITGGKFAAGVAGVVPCLNSPAAGVVRFSPIQSIRLL